MTTDNRTNEPTEEQIEAAALAMHRLPVNIGGGRGFSYYVEPARAALEAAARAAQGAAPQAKSVPKSIYISPSLPGMISNLWKSDPSENSVRTALKLAGDLIQELIDLKAAPVLPSSGVDEARAAAARAEAAEAAIERIRAIIALDEKQDEAAGEYRDPDARREQVANRTIMRIQAALAPVTEEGDKE